MMRLNELLAAQTFVGVATSVSVADFALFFAVSQHLVIVILIYHVLDNVCSLQWICECCSLVFVHARYLCFRLSNPRNCQD